MYHYEGSQLAEPKCETYKVVYRTLLIKASSMRRKQTYKPDMVSKTDYSRH